MTDLTAGTKKQADIANRRKLVAIYTLKKMDQVDIADKVGVDQSTISRDLKFLTKQWEAKAQDKISTLRARELAELELMEFEAAVQIQGLLSEKGEKDLGMALKYSEYRLKIKGMRIGLLGLDAPKKLDIDGDLRHSGEMSVHALSDEELMQIISDGSPE